MQGLQEKSRGICEAAEGGLVSESTESEKLEEREKRKKREPNEKRKEKKTKASVWPPPGMKRMHAEMTGIGPNSAEKAVESVYSGYDKNIRMGTAGGSEKG